MQEKGMGAEHLGAEEKRTRGQLTIFFGCAPGVGKTDAMVRAALEAAERGTDAVIGCLGGGCSPGQAAGLERIPPRQMSGRDTLREELDLDGALERAPDLILVDELAHGNAPGSRHAKRYQDVKELLNHGIDVYTTVSVQHIESLADVVASVTGEMVGERIPDSVFDSAERVILVDPDPAGAVRQGRLGPDALTALRELARTRCAQRVERLTDGGGAAGGRASRGKEHILVCLSSAPSNPTIIRTAARMANAFRGAFTALFVETPAFPSMREEDKERLRANMRLARRLGAKIETVYGEDVPTQIVEFARLSGVSRIVIGRSAAGKRRMLSKPSLTERLIDAAPNMDIHIIPDAAGSGAYREARERHRKSIAFSAADVVRSLLILLCASAGGVLFDRLGFTEANIVTLYILGVLLIAVTTGHQIYSLAAALVSVIVFNFLFAEPRYTLLTYDHGYPVTFLIMFLAAFLTGSLAVRLKDSAKQSARAAWRTKILFDTNQLLQQATGREQIAEAAAGQLTKLLERDVVFYLTEGDALSEPQLFPAGEGPADRGCLAPGEREAARWVMENNRHAGATTDTLSRCRCLYLAVRINEAVYGVAGIVIGETPLDAFENSILLSILGECALALENEKNAREKEEAAVLAKNEKLRGNLLRAISHDLRTPLTSISGNASILLTDGDHFTHEVRQGLYRDIYDDSQWLINLVENLLAVTRLEDGEMRLNISSELVDDLVEEALRHVCRQSTEHTVTAEHGDELLLVRTDARLIVQVIINLVDNAFKYTPPGSTIRITTGRQGDRAVIRVADNGPGIPDEAKERVFERFYTGASRVADSRRSLGLGLALCRSIITAHGGEITVEDNDPRGAVFSFTLPVGEVELYE